MGVLVVGNPANTNALIISHYAPSIPKENFSAMTRLDQNRAASQLALKVGARVQDVRKMTIWGNHSSTQFPDAFHATINGKSVTSLINNDAWIQNEFIPNVQKRGAAVIAARKLSSAMSAAKAACDHMKSWVQGTPADDWVSMGVFSDGAYSTPKGVMFSFPVTCSGGKWKIVQVLIFQSSIFQPHFFIFCLFQYDMFCRFPLTGLCRACPCLSLQWASLPRPAKSFARRERRPLPSAKLNQHKKVAKKKATVAIL